MKQTVSPPRWKESTGPRVLVEASDWAQQETLNRILGRAGYDVLTCDGPVGSNSRCSLVADGVCPGCDGADVVVNALRHTEARNREVLLEIQKRHPDLPVVVEVPGPRAERYPDDFANCIVIAQPMTSDSLLAAVEKAFGAEPAAS